MATTPERGADNDRIARLDDPPANAEQLRMQAMLQTMIAVILTDEQRKIYNK